MLIAVLLLLLLVVLVVVVVVVVFVVVFVVVVVVVVVVLVIIVLPIVASAKHSVRDVGETRCGDRRALRMTARPTGKTDQRWLILVVLK